MNLIARRNAENALRRKLRNSRHVSDVGSYIRLSKSLLVAEKPLQATAVLLRNIVIHQKTRLQEVVQLSLCCTRRPVAGIFIWVAAAQGSKSPSGGPGERNPGSDLGHKDPQKLKQFTDNVYRF